MAHLAHNLATSAPSTLHRYAKPTGRDTAKAAQQLHNRGASGAAVAAAEEGAADNGSPLLVSERCGNHELPHT